MKQIWIVDDDEEMGRAIGLMLTLLDCEATLFFNARTSVQALLSGKKPDLMIVDVNMPEVSGLDLIEFLRRRPEWKDTDHHAFDRSCRHDGGKGTQARRGCIRFETSYPGRT
jgi:CheY-like chemotaxis protein